MRKSKDQKNTTEHQKQLFSSVLFSKLPELNFIGNQEVVIEGSRGVLEYSEDVIRINTCMGVVVFEGRALNLKCISSTKLIIDGFISKLEFIL